MIIEKLSSDISRLVRTNGFWFTLSISAAAFLQIAPTFQPEMFTRKQLEMSFAATAGCLTIAALTSGKVEYSVTDLRIKNRMRHQYQIDSYTHAVNWQRAANANQIRLLNGSHTMGEITQMMGEQMRYMAEMIQGGTTAQLPAGEDGSQFSLSLIKNSPKAHILLIGESGSGKTTLARYLAIELFAGKDLGVYDVDDDGRQWGALPVWGREDNFSELAGAMKDDLSEFKTRSEQRTAGERLDKYVRILEECPSTLPEVRGSYEWLTTMLRRGRKRAMGIVGISQEPNADSFTCQTREGKKQEVSAALLKNFSKFFLLGYAFAMLDQVRDREERKELEAALKQCDRPCLVLHDGRWYWWAVPDLKHWQMPDLGLETKILKELCEDDDPRAKLENLFNLELDPRLPDPSELADEQIDRLIAEHRQKSNKPKSSLSAPAQIILDKYRQKEMNGKFISASWVKNFAFRSKELNQISPDGIRCFFNELAEAGYGAIAGEGSQMAWGMVED